MQHAPAVEYPLPRGAAIPPAVVPWQPDPRRCALLVHHIHPHTLGTLAPGVRHHLLHNITRIAARCREVGIPIVTTCPADSHTIPPAPHRDETTIAACRDNAFLHTDLDAWLRGRHRDQLLICGVYAHTNCLMTAAHASITDRQPFVVADGTADRSPDEHHAALQYIAYRCGLTISTETAIQALAAAAPQPHPHLNAA
ncbi:Phenazine biosynthesis protein PhzD2 [Austwickia sp. TVS 96-490-7B]|uniref:isochorismatase family protein n=1 Tax=Austwickia sp. TVS 96-490-7B TaxID=2830843 RepID=UPI001C57DC08|nr:isochorismatase family protein [Austwickia sp. TVS 96-490-7B]MBW3086747.1 Phenazine biosynthesis protein PhzD2 [Austwickia sp. TVS 96-490-7B]